MTAPTPLPQCIQRPTWSSMGEQVTSKHAPIPRQRSRLWHTAASLGEVDSLQNAVDAFKVRGILYTSRKLCGLHLCLQAFRARTTA